MIKISKSVIVLLVFCGIFRLTSARTAKIVGQFELMLIDKPYLQELRYDSQNPNMPSERIIYQNNNDSYRLRTYDGLNGVDYFTEKNETKIRFVFGRSPKQNREIIIKNNKVQQAVWRHGDKYVVYLFKDGKKLLKTDEEKDLKKYIKYEEFGYVVYFRVLEEKVQKPDILENNIGYIYNLDNLVIYKIENELSYIMTNGQGKFSDLACIFNNNRLIYYSTDDQVFSEVFGVDMTGDKITVMHVNGDFADIDIYDNDWNYLESRKQIPYTALQEKEKEVRAFLKSIRFSKKKKK